MRIYLDNCALGRLSDDTTQELVRIEAQAVEHIFAGVDVGMYPLVASEILLAEVLRNLNAGRRAKALFLIGKASGVQSLTPAIMRSAERVAQRGLGLADALHLYSALAAGCEVLLTTDSRFLRQVARLTDVPPEFVRNPVDL